MKFKIFLSSNQQEFENEREFVKREIEQDYVLNRFFEVFSFEETSASGKTPVELYSHEVVNSDVYIGLIGSDYGNISESGISATEYEYNLFNKAHNDVLIFLKDVKFREDNVNTFIEKIKDEHSYQTFKDKYELYFEVRRSLCDFLEKNLINYRAYDSELLLDSSCDDVDMEAVEMFFNSVDYSPIKNLRDEKGLVNALSTINAGEYYDGEFKLNVAGALFFAKDLSKFNIPHEVKMVHFFDDSGFKKFEKNVSNTSLIKVLKECEEFFFKHTRHISEVKGFHRYTSHEYPFNAIREALVNALAHRDYTIPSASVNFYIYPDRIEVKSPGRLKYPLNIYNFEENEPIHRNANICNIFSNTIYMEHVGRGIKQMRDLMKNHGLDEPDFFENNDFFKVVFKSNYILNYSNGLNDRQIKFLRSEKSQITISQYQKMFNVSRNTAIRDLNKLEEENFVIKSKNGRINIFKIISDVGIK